MSEAPARRRLPKPTPAALWRVLTDIVRRAYALVLGVVIVWLTFLAARYLVNSLIRPSAAPPQVLGLPTRLTADVLATRRQAWSGVQAVPHARSPLAHYHRMDGWVQPDAFNDCTRSGCHRPLPHARRKEVRAFLNLHATSLHCGVCHLQSDDTPLSLTWYDLQTGKATDAPAALQAYELVTSAGSRQRLAAATAADQNQLARLLRTAARQADNVPALTQLAEHVAAVRPGGEAFAALVDAVRDALPRHFRGEYGAKLALRDRQSRRPVLVCPESAQAVRNYLNAVRSRTELAEDQRKLLLDAVHGARRPEPLHCTDCHRREGSLVDLAAVGYPAARREALSAQIIFQMIEHISRGQPLHLPQFIMPGAQPASAPTTQPQQP